MNIQIKRILVAKDLSKQSANVIRYALELGSKFDARIHVLHVIPTMETPVLNMVSLAMGPDRLAQFNAETEKEMTEKTRRQLDALIAEETRQGDFRLSHPPAVEVHHGDPAAMILTVADSIDADMIILGSHSKGVLYYAFLGSVAQKVLHKTHRTVVVLPPTVGNAQPAS